MIRHVTPIASKNKSDYSKSSYVENSVRPLQFLLIISPFLMGLFFEWASCLASLYLIYCLLYYRHSSGFLILPKSITFLSTVVFSVSYALTAIWGVDHGMAIVGFCKFLPLPLFYLAACQISHDKQQMLLEQLPWTGAAMTVISALLSSVPLLNGYIVVNHRLAGFFQYPNTFALYLLIGIVILLEKRRVCIQNIACLLILLFGILMSGSRTVFALLVVTIIFIFVQVRNMKTTLVLFFLFAAALLIASISLAAIGQLPAMIERYLTSPFQSSAFLGRVLYLRDAIPVLLSHPFGLGYLGYSFTQGSFQTGVYSLQNIHNELFQFLLDVGWFPTLLMVCSCFHGFLHGDKLRRIILFLILSHCMFDFDLQFIVMDLVLLSVLDLDVRQDSKKLAGPFLPTTAGLLGCFCLYIGIASGLYYTGNYQQCVKLYPGYTSAWISLLSQAKAPEDMDKLADQILQLNHSVSLAWSAKARVAYSAGDIGSVISFKEKAISLSKYSLAEYLDYIDMLYVGIQLYEENGDRKSAEICRDHLLSIPDTISSVLNSTSPIGWQIFDKPDLTLPEKYRNIIDQFRQD